MPSSKKNKPVCYAVAKGKIPGVYFSWEEAHQQVRGFRNNQYKSFTIVAEAKKFLKSKGLTPIISGEWLSTKRTPLLYKDDDNHKTNDSSGQNKRKSPLNSNLPATVSVDSSPETDDQRKRPRTVAAFFQTQKEKQLQKQVQEQQLQLQEDTQQEQDPQQQQDPQQMADPQRAHKAAAPAAPAPAPSLDLDPIQQRAIDAALDGKNVFITGVAGTGKSLVTRMIVENARAKQDDVAVAAPTGVAAVNLNLGAQTVHSLAGVRVPNRARDFGTIFNRATANKWRKMQTLVIDEIGMLTGDFLDWLDVKVREVRRKPLEPFGGIQLIFVGDFARKYNKSLGYVPILVLLLLLLLLLFFLLPLLHFDCTELGPVPGSISLEQNAYDPSDEGADCFLNIKECTAYAFQSAVWREANFYHVHLKKVYRQSDQDFVRALMDLRESRADSSLVQNLVKKCAIPFEDRPDLVIPEGIIPTVLYCTNYKVDKENQGKTSL